MNIKESVYLAFDAVYTHKLRSVLTTLGITIGVMTVIAVVSLITGLNKKIKGELSAIGSNIIYVQKYSWVHTGGDWWKFRGRKNLEIADADAIARLCSEVKEVVPSTYRRTTVKYRDKNREGVQIVGTGPLWQDIEGHFVEYGRFLTNFDVRRRKFVCIIGDEIVENLFEKTDPIGEKIKVAGNKFQVVGILEKKGKIFGSSMDNIVVIPISSFHKIFGKRRSISIMVVPKAEKEKAIDQIRGVLRMRRKVGYGKEDDFSINTQDLLMDMYNKLTGAAFAVMLGVTSLSLIIGGIGIMNIMLVSVTERTREIGIRKAIGARKKDILWQFLIEAMGISSVGGVIGIILGFTVAKVISSFSRIPSTIPIWSVLLGIGFSCGVGLFFGIFPSLKAAKLDPIEALRYE